MPNNNNELSYRGKKPLSHHDLHFPSEGGIAPWRLLAEQTPFVEHQ